MRVNGVELFVKRLGDPSKPPLVVVHGGPTWDHSYLLPAVGELTDVAHVVLFDLRGCGRSQRGLDADRLQPESSADDVAGLIRGLGFEAADVLGFSYGGRIAMRVVQRHPGLVRRVVLASTTAYVNYLFEDPEYPRRKAMCAPVGFDDSKAMAYADVPTTIWRLDRRDEWHRVIEEVRFSDDYNEPYAAGKLRSGAPENAPRILREWGRPVLVLHGARDFGFPVEVARRLHAELPGSSLAEIPEAGHMAHFDNPGPWVGAIREFLARTNPSI